MMNIFVINLDRAPERLAHMKSVLGAYDLPFTRVAAIDGRNLTADDMQRWRAGKPNFYELGRGEVACFLSHRECWRRIAEEGLDHGVVLEDDIVLGEKPAAVLKVSSWLPTDADIVKLDTSNRSTRRDRLPTSVVGNRLVVRLRGAHPGGAGYIVSLNGARKLLSLSNGFCDPVDQFLFNPASVSFDKTVIYQLAPALCGQSAPLGLPVPAILTSSLHEERRLNRRTGWSKFKKEVLRPLEQMRIWIEGVAVNLRGKHSWQKVPYA